MSDTRQIIKETRKIGAYEYQVWLTYYTNRKRFSVGACPLEESIGTGWTSMSMSDMMAIQSVYLPIVVSRFSKKAEAEAREMFEEHLKPVLKQCFELQLTKFEAKDFGEAIDGLLPLNRSFAATCNLIEDPMGFVEDKPDLPSNGWAKGKIDNRPVRLFLQLIWKGDADRPWVCGQYLYLVSAETPESTL